MSVLSSSRRIFLRDRLASAGWPIGVTAVVSLSTCSAGGVPILVAVEHELSGRAGLVVVGRGESVDAIAD